MTNHPNRSRKLILVRSDAGDGGWSLHVPSSTDEEIATGEAAALVAGTAEWINGEWSRPTQADYEVARNAIR
jgi:hypothetical protein